MRDWAARRVLPALARLMMLGFLLLIPSPPVSAAPVYLIRTIRVAQNPLVLAIDQPSDSILAPGGYPDQYADFNQVTALSILDGRSGKVERAIAQSPLTASYLNEPAIVPSVDGSGRAYVEVDGNSGLKVLLPGGIVHPAGFALPATAHGPIAVDQQRDRLVGAFANSGVNGYLLSASQQVWSVQVENPSNFAFDQPSGALYMAETNGLTKREVRAGHLLAQAAVGPVYLSQLVQSLHLVVTLGGDPDAPDLDKVSVLDARTLKVLASTNIGPLGDYVGHGPIPDSWQPLAIDAGAGRAVVLVVSQGNGANPSAAPPGWALLIDLHSGRVVHKVTVTGMSPWDVAVDSTLHRAFITSLYTSTLSVVDTRSGALVATVRVGAKPFSVVVDERDQTVFVSNGYSAGSGPTGTVTMFDAHITGNHG